MKTKTVKIADIYFCLVFNLLYLVGFIGLWKSIQIEATDQILFNIKKFVIIAIGVNFNIFYLVYRYFINKAEKSKYITSEEKLKRMKIAYPLVSLTIFIGLFLIAWNIR